MTIQGIIDAVSGFDENGNTKAVCAVSLDKYDLNDTTKDPDVLMSAVTMDAMLTIKTIGYYTYIEMLFPTETCEGINLFYRALEDYFDEYDETDDEDEVMVSMSLIPIALAGEYYIAAVAPVFWALEPDYVGGERRILRIVYNAEDVTFVESEMDTDLIDTLIAQAQEGDNKIDNINDAYGHEYTPEKAEELTAREERDQSFSDPSYFEDEYGDDEDYDKDDDDEDDEDDDDDDETSTDRRSYRYH